MTLPYFEKSDPRESSSGKTYEFGITAEGKLTCNCTGWTTKKANRPRYCKHTTEGSRSLVRRLGLNVVARGDYYFLKDVEAFKRGAGPFPGSTPAVAPAPTPAPKSVKKPSAQNRVEPVEPTRGDIIVDSRSDKSGKKRFKTFTVVEDTLSLPSSVPETAQEAIEAVASGFIAPMLASPMPGLPDQRVVTVLAALSKYNVLDYVVEEKFDGHRAIVEVRPDGTVFAWSRTGKPFTETRGGLPEHIVAAFKLLPLGTYDGELLVPGGVSTDVTKKTDVSKLVFVVFDVLALLGQDTTGKTYDERREFLNEIFSRIETSPLYLAKASAPTAEFVKEIFARGGEGAILKRRDATYKVGRRTLDFIKIKGLEIELMQITGYEKGKLGPCARVKVRNPKDGSTTTFAAMGGGSKLLKALTADPDAYIGRYVMLEYQFRTDDGNYRHPRFDRWAESIDLQQRGL